jgi:hypothetical protein
VHGDIDANDISYLIRLTTWKLRAALWDHRHQAPPRRCQPSELNIDRTASRKSSISTRAATSQDVHEPRFGGADLFSGRQPRLLVVYDLDNDGVIGGDESFRPADNTAVPVVAQYGMFTIQSTAHTHITAVRR